MTRIRMIGWILAAVLLAAAPAPAETFHNKNGVVFEGTIRLVVSNAAVCNVLEEKYTAQEYEQLKANQGQPLDLWQVDFAVRNESGREIEYLRASSWVHSEHPPCTNWSGEGPGGGPALPEPSLLISTGWGDYYQVLQRPSGMRPGQQERRARYLVVFDEHQPRFGEWDIDYTFAKEAGAGKEPAAGASRTPVSGGATSTAPAGSESQENLFWQSIMNSTAAADFEAYLRQFPNGIFRVLAQNRLAALGAPGSDLPAPNRFPAEADSQADHVETPQPICEDERKWDDPPCWVELTSHPSCYVWVRHQSVVVSSMGWTGSCANRRAEGSGTLEWITSNEFTYPQRATGLLRGGKRTGRWTYPYLANWVSEVPYVDGKKHGTEIDRGSSYGTVVTTPWVNGKIHGTRVERDGDGNVVERVEYVNGVKQ